MNKQNNQVIPNNPKDHLIFIKNRIIEKKQKIISDKYKYNNCVYDNYCYETDKDITELISIMDYLINSFR